VVVLFLYQVYLKITLNDLSSAVIFILSCGRDFLVAVTLKQIFIYGGVQPLCFPQAIMHNFVGIFNQ